MANILFVDIVGDTIAWAQVSAVGQRPTVSGWGQMPTELTPRHAHEIGLWLLDHLVKTGVKTDNVVVSVGRSRTNVKYLSIPPCPDAELPAMVAFTLESDGALGVGEQVIDFHASNRKGEDREVLAAILPAATVTSIETICRTAKLHLKRIVFRPYAIQFLASHSISKGIGAHPLVIVSGLSTIEFSVWEKDRLLLSRSVPSGSPEEANHRTLQEARRTMAAFSSQNSNISIDNVVVISTAAEELAAELREALALPVHALTTAKDVNESSDQMNDRLIAAIGGGWHELKSQAWHIDFLDPKKPVIAPNRTKSLSLVLGISAMIVVVAGYSITHYFLNQKEQRIASIGSELDRISNQINALAPVIKQHQVTKEWVSSEVSWLNELDDLTRLFPDTTDIFLTAADFKVPEGAKSPTVRIEGRSKTDFEIMELERLLAQDEASHYFVLPLKKETTPDPTDYLCFFQTDLNVTPLQEKQYVKRAQDWQNKTVENVPSGKRRDNVPIITSLAAANSKLTPSASTSNPGNSYATKGPDAATSKDGNNDRNRTNRNRRNNTTFNNNQGTTSRDNFGSSNADATDPITKLVNELKELPADKREERINKAPKFTQKRLRERLKEATKK